MACFLFTEFELYCKKRKDGMTYKILGSVKLDVKKNGTTLEKRNTLMKTQRVTCSIHEPP